MKRILKAMTEDEVKLLTEFLENPERPAGTLRFHELQGFLFTIASSPETIPTSEWLPLISDDEDIGFADEGEARQILNSIMALYNDVNTAVLNRSRKLPRGCSFVGELDANFGENSRTAFPRARLWRWNGSRPACSRPDQQRKSRQRGNG